MPNNMMNDSAGLNGLAVELRLLETSSFEITDYADSAEFLTKACSTSCVSTGA